MPEEVEDCVEEVMAEGHDESSAYAICNASVGEKSFSDTELAQMLKEDGAQEWVDTVGRLVRNDVEKTVIADVVKRARSGSRQEAQKAMAKSAKLEKVGFEAEMSSQLTVFKAGDDDFVIWGPASVEVVDKEGDRIKAKALEKALPQLLKRARLSLEHSDQLVGRILERFETDDPVEVKIGDNTLNRSEFPTDVLELEKMEPALYVAGEIFDDSRQARDTRKRIQEGELNSYSISGEALVTQKKVTSDGEAYDDIVDLDLSAVTICEEGMNQKAKFAQISESGDKTASATAKSDDPVSSQGGQGEAPTVSAVANLAKSAIDDTMTETEEKSSDNSDGSFDPEALSAEFKSVLDSKLPDGELATKEDTLQREDVESIAREVYNAEKEGEDEAGEEDQEDSGTSDTDEDSTSGRPGDEADVEGDEAEKGDAREAAADLADEYGVRPGEVMDALEALANGADEGGDEDEEKGDYEEEEEMEDEEEKGDDEPPAPEEEEEEAPPEEEEEPPEEEAPPEEEEEPPAPEEESKEGYSAEEMEEMLPADVWEVVREYLDEGGEPAPGGEAEGEEGEEVMASEKSDDIESAVEKILSGKGLEKAGGASTPSEDVEKSYDEEPADAGHGNNPALATFYGE